MNTENRWFVNLARNQNSLVVVARLSFCKKSGTRLSQLMNTCGFHQNVGEGNKSLNAMFPDPLLSEAFGKGSGCAACSNICTFHMPCMVGTVFRLVILVETCCFCCKGVCYKFGAFTLLLSLACFFFCLFLFFVLFCS